MHFAVSQHNKISKIRIKDYNIIIALYCVPKIAINESSYGYSDLNLEFFGHCPAL